MKITIIGLGWLGTSLAEVFSLSGHDVYGSVTTAAKLKPFEKTTIEAFVYSTEGKAKIPASVAKSTEVLILTIPPNRDASAELYGTTLLSVVKQFANLQRVIFTSSTGIYPKTNNIFTESFLFLEKEKRSALYQAEKALEKELGDKLITVRLAGLFGGKRHPVLKLQGKQFVQNPYGVVNLVHRDDVYRAMVALLEANKSGIYNIVYPEHPYRKEYYTKLYRYYNLQPILFEDTPWIERKISTAKLMSELNFRYEKSITDVGDILS